MRRFLLPLVVAANFAVPAFAYDECGLPPDTPYLPPKPATASEEDARSVQQGDHDFAQDTEGYLICLQLAEADVNEEAQRGERTALSAEVLRQTFQHHAGEARGHQSGWGRDYDRWSEAWTRAHRRAMPALAED